MSETPKRPEKMYDPKLTLQPDYPDDYMKGKVYGYNQAIDDYEKYLPNIDDIEEIIYSLKNDKGELPPDSIVAKAIYNRIQGE